MIVSLPRQGAHGFARRRGKPSKSGRRAGHDYATQTAESGDSRCTWCAGIGLPAIRALTNVQIGGDMVGAMRTRKQHPIPSRRVLLADNGFPHTAFAAETAAPAVLWLRHTTRLLCATAAHPCVRTRVARNRVKAGHYSDSTSAQTNFQQSSCARSEDACGNIRPGKPTQESQWHTSRSSATLRKH